MIPATHGECTSLKSHHQIWTHQTYIHPATILHLKADTLVPEPMSKYLVLTNYKKRTNEELKLQTNTVSEDSNKYILPSCHSWKGESPTANDVPVNQSGSSDYQFHQTYSNHPKYCSMHGWIHLILVVNQKKDYY